MSSYTSQSTSLKALIREARHLYEHRAGEVTWRVDFILTKLKNLERQLEREYGFTLANRDVLDIGAGQFLIQMHSFAQRNRVVGIDFDVIAQGFSLETYLQMLRFNGPRRTIKTLGRKLLGIDRRYAAELAMQLNVVGLPKLRVFRMDACNMTFPVDSFDFVHAYSVFHHLPNPKAAIEGIVRILRPGGVVFISLHLYTSDSGCLDPRVFSEQRGDFPLWAHLRSEFKNEVQSNAYVNALRLSEWQALFETKMPGARLIFNRTEQRGIEESARELLDRGELEGYSLEELLVNEIVVLWRKP